MSAETVSIGFAVLLGLSLSTGVVALGLLTKWKRTPRPVPAPVR
jgi:hypothetical protein